MFICCDVSVGVVSRYVLSLVSYFQCVFGSGRLCQRLLVSVVAGKSFNYNNSLSPSLAVRGGRSSFNCSRLGVLLCFNLVTQASACSSGPISANATCPILMMLAILVPLLLGSVPSFQTTATIAPVPDETAFQREILQVAHQRYKRRLKRWRRRQRRREGLAPPPRPKQWRRRRLRYCLQRRAGCDIRSSDMDAYVLWVA